MKNLKIIDLSEIKQEHCPLFVQSGDMRGFLGWGIKFRTKSDWSHSMIMRRPGFVCSQGWTYKEIPISKYDKRGVILKFWICKGMTLSEFQNIMIKIEEELRLPFWKRMYDFPGIIGQAIGLRWINVPFLRYCSERVASKLRILIPSLRKKPNPEDIDLACKESERMSVYGYSFHKDF